MTLFRTEVNSQTGEVVQIELTAEELWAFQPEAQPLYVPAEVSRPQAAQEMFERGLITGPEMVAMCTVSTPPAIVEAMLATLPEPDGYIARADFARYTYARNNPLLNALMGGVVSVQQPTATEAEISAVIDDFFSNAAAR